MEQDTSAFAGELPTYNELAAKSSPNSRFGRWKSWVDKRAAERYADETPESREARRKKGWGPQVDTREPEAPISDSLQAQPSLGVGLTRRYTVLSNPPHPDTDGAYPSTSQITVDQALSPSHLRLHSFGSRFLPHSDLPIQCCLPLFNHQKLLLGHADGLNILDMTPEATSNDLGSREPRRRDIWYGDGVYQLEILEYELSLPSSTPFGVVLALVSAEPPENVSEKEAAGPHKAIRMYSLSSLANLVRWATVRKDNKPLDLSRPPHRQPQQKKSKNHLNVPKNINNLFSPQATNNVYASHPRRSESPPPPPPPPKDWPRPPPEERRSLDNPDSAESWDIVGDDDAPLRWATDFVPLAAASSRLANHSVLFFELNKSTDGGRVTARLAVATKQHIFLYESVRGERAFRFVKEFYTPIPARSITFLEQSSYEPITKIQPPASVFLSLANYKTDNASRRISTPVPITPSKTGQLSLFVIFEKKAGLIKISDSSVGEIELWEEPGHSRHSSASLSAGSLRRSLPLPDAPKDNKGPWAPPAATVLPLASSALSNGAMAAADWSPRRSPRSKSPSLDTSFDFPPPQASGLSVYLLTRGKTTHIVRAPLAMPLAAHAPLTVLAWCMRPSHVVPRLCEHPVSGEPFLQVTALGNAGVEVQELDLAFARAAAAATAMVAGDDEGGATDAGGASSKGKAREASRVAVQAEVGPGGAGFLCAGGHWSEMKRRHAAPTTLQRHGSSGSVDSAEVAAQYARTAGFYAWTQYAINDWRVFWLGGDAKDGEAPPPPVSP